MKLLSLVIFTALLVLPADRVWSAPECSKFKEQMSSSHIEHCSLHTALPASTAIEDIDGWNDLKFGSSLAAVKSIYNDAKVSSCFKDDNSCKKLHFTKEAYGEKWSVVATIDANAGLSSIYLSPANQLSSIDQRLPLFDRQAQRSRYDKIKQALAAQHGKGVERSFDDQERGCKAAAAKTLQDQSVFLFEFVSREKEISYEIKAPSGVVEIKLIEPQRCPNIPANVLKQIEDAWYIPAIRKFFLRSDPDWLTIEFSRNSGNSRW